MPKIIIFYFAREWTIWFMGCLGFLLGTTFLFSVIEDMEMFFPQGLDHFGINLWHWILSFLPWLLPIAALGASLFSLSFIRKRGEWSAMVANGFSPWQVFSLVLVLGLAIAFACDWLMKQRSGMNLSHSTMQASSLKMQVGLDRLWYFRSFDPNLGEGTGLQLFCYGKKGENVLRIHANRAVWNPEHGWTFYHGRFLGFYSENGLPILNQKGNQIVWEYSGSSNDENLISGSTSPGINRRFEKLINFEFKDDPLPFLWLQKRPKDMNTAEIDRLLENFSDSKSKKIVPYKIRRAQLMWNGPACIVALLIGLAMGISKFSSSPSRLAGIALLGSLIFFLIHRFSYSLGIEQIISPDLAASLPFILIIFLAFVLFRIQK